MAESSLFQKFRLLGKQSAVYGIGTLAERLAIFLLLPLYTQVLTAAEFGVLGLILVTGQIASTVCALGLRSSLFRSFYDYEDERSRRTVVSTVLYITAASSAVLAVAGIGLAGTLSVALCGTRAYQAHFVLAFLFTICELFNQIAFAVFRARQQARTYAGLQLVVLLLRIGLILYFVVVRDLGVFGVLLGRLLAAVLAALVLLALIREYLVARFSWHDARLLIRYGAPLAVVGVFGFVSTYVDRYVLTYYVSLHEVGLYTLAYQLGMLMVVGLITPLKLVWGPMFLSVKDHADFAAFCARTLTYVWFLGGLLFLLVALLSRELLRVISAPEYWDAYAPVPVIAATYLIWSTRSVLEVGAVLRRTMTAIAGITAGGALANLLLNVVLIPRYGIMGAAVATLLSFTATIVADYFYNRTLTRIRYEWGRLVRATAVVAVLFAAGRCVAGDGLLVSAALKLGIICLYPVCLVLFRCVEKPELARIKQVIRGLFAGRAAQ